MVEEQEWIFLNSMALMLKYIRSVYWIYEHITFFFKTEENVFLLCPSARDFAPEVLFIA